MAILLILLAFIFAIGNARAYEDMTPQLNVMAKERCQQGSLKRTIKFDAGDFHFKTQPEPFNCAINIIGEGVGATRLIKNYNDGRFLTWTRGIDHSGGSIKDLNILAGSHTQKGIAIYIQALQDENNQENSYNRHSFYIDNIIVGREDLTSSFEYGLYLDGSENIDGRDGFAPGIRGIFISHATFSGTMISQIYINKGRGIDLQTECYISLNNSFGGITIDNATQSVKVDSRSCLVRKIDTSSSAVMLNGKYIY